MYVQQLSELRLVIIKSNRAAGKTYAWIGDHLNELGVTTVNGSRCPNNGAEVCREVKLTSSSFT